MNILKALVPFEETGCGISWVVIRPVTFSIAPTLSSDSTLMRDAEINKIHKVNSFATDRMIFYINLLS